MVVGRDGARCRCGRPSGLQAGASPRAARDPEAGGAFPACRYPGLVRAGDEEPGRAPPTPRLPAEPQAPSGPHARRVGRPQETKPVEPIEEKPKVKTKFQKRSEKLYAVLKPPYFILTVIIIIVSMYLWGSERARMRLEWSPGAWWREPWRLLSYGAIHASATHLATNAIVALAGVGVCSLRQARATVAAALLPRHTRLRHVPSHQRRCRSSGWLGARTRAGSLPRLRDMGGGAGGGRARSRSIATKGAGRWRVGRGVRAADGASAERVP
ncbi:uncharacterized protein LOC125228319 isoform X2 [Leguminivora glycinivorella]|uniref:uncharacterized protein LOC125228319 isoform X2 n=1 Tax=Leguminivora glycinivorella TaxID=1035111 RepID=UPI00201049F9|nr:uncharacterized protein LOC125228319 isoform X2 [Leguminivora glycinivorella]